MDLWLRRPPSLLRQPPGLTGFGLLEQVPADDILTWEDPTDQNGDGISGRANG